MKPPKPVTLDLGVKTMLPEQDDHNIELDDDEEAGLLAARAALRGSGDSENLAVDTNEQPSP